MGEYLVEGYLPRPGSDELPRAAARARGAADELAQAGTPVRYLGAIFIPGDETCFHLYEAPSAGAARTASMRAGIKFERIVDAVRVAAEATDPSESPTTSSDKED